jgi:hypothetical protein
LPSSLTPARTFDLSLTELIKMATVANAAGDQTQRDAYLRQAETLIRFAADATLQRYSVYAVARFSVQPPADDG